MNGKIFTLRGTPFEKRRGGIGRAGYHPLLGMYVLHSRGNPNLSNTGRPWFAKRVPEEMRQSHALLKSAEGCHSSISQKDFWGKA